MCIQTKEHRRNQDFCRGEGAQTTNHIQWRRQKFLKQEVFVGLRYRKIEDQKPWSGLPLNQDLAEERGLKPKVKKRNYLNWEMCLAKKSVTQTYHRRGFGDRGPRGWAIFLKLNYFNVFGSHFAGVQSRLKELDF